jgi:hypothetical protein
MQSTHPTIQLCKVRYFLFIILEISLIRAVYGVEREFDRYYLRLRNSLRGTASHLVGGEQEDNNLFEYAIKQNAESWDNEVGCEFEELEK